MQCTVRAARAACPKKEKVVKGQVWGDSGHNPRCYPQCRRPARGCSRLGGSANAWLPTVCAWPQPSWPLKKQRISTGRAEADSGDSSEIEDLIGKPRAPHPKKKGSPRKWDPGFRPMHTAGAVRAGWPLLLLAEPASTAFGRFLPINPEQLCEQAGRFVVRQPQVLDFQGHPTNCSAIGQGVFTLEPRLFPDSGGPVKGQLWGKNWHKQPFIHSRARRRILVRRGRTVRKHGCAHPCRFAKRLWPLKKERLSTVAAFPYLLLPIR